MAICFFGLQHKFYNIFSHKHTNKDMSYLSLSPYFKSHFFQVNPG